MSRRTRGAERLGSVAAMVLTLTLALAIATQAFGQGNDAALKDRVGQLVAKLDSDKPEIREAAVKSLADLGPRILPHLEPLEKAGTPDRQKLVAALRARLAEADAKVNVGASKITLKRKKIRLSEAVKELQSSSGNRITDLREQMGAEVTNPTMDLDLEAVPFLQALDIVAEKAAVGLSFYTGDSTIGIVAGGMAPGGMAPDKPKYIYSGPFRIELKEITTQRKFDAAGATTNLQFEVVWEPRLRPMLLALKYDKVDVVGDDGVKIPAGVGGDAVAGQAGAGGDDVTLTPGNPAIELNLNLQAPARKVKELASIKLHAEVTVPTDVKRFAFKNLTESDAVVKDGDVTVTLESARIEEITWTVELAVAYPTGGKAFESFRQGTFSNQIWLQKADGARFEHNSDVSNDSSEDGRIKYEYRFIEVPGKLADYGVVFETPSKVVPIPLDFEFKKIALP